MILVTKVCLSVHLLLNKNMIFSVTELPGCKLAVCEINSARNSEAGKISVEKKKLKEK